MRTKKNSDAEEALSETEELLIYIVDAITNAKEMEQVEKRNITD